MGEYDDLLGRGEYAHPSRDELKARADAAEARVAELEAMVDELAAAHKSAHGDWSIERGRAVAAEAERDRLRDGISALADEWEQRAQSRETHHTHREWIAEDGARVSGYVSDNPRAAAEGAVFDTCSRRLAALLNPPTEGVSDA